jgi:signal peptidase II
VGASASLGRPLAVSFAAAAATLLLDQATKALASATLSPVVSVTVLGPLHLTLTRNTGFAFGLLPGTAVFVVKLLVTLGVLWYVTLGKGLLRHPGYALGLGLVLGGSLGNLVDRFRTGAVIDFIDFRIWPVFNGADIAITVGVGLVMIRLLRAR